MFLIKMITIAYGLHHLMTSKRVPETVRVKLEKKLADPDVKQFSSLDPSLPFLDNLVKQGETEAEMVGLWANYCLSQGISRSLKRGMNVRVPLEHYCSSVNNDTFDLGKEVAFHKSIGVLEYSNRNGFHYFSRVPALAVGVSANIRKMIFNGDCPSQITPEFAQKIHQRILETGAYNYEDGDHALTNLAVMMRRGFKEFEMFGGVEEHCLRVAVGGAMIKGVKIRVPKGYSCKADGTSNLLDLVGGSSVDVTENERFVYFTPK